MQTSVPSQSSSTIRYSALFIGLFFLILGLAGFMPAFVSYRANPTEVPGFGYLFGLFPTNYFHNAIGILVGLWGIAASTSLSGAIVFNRIFALVYAIAAILGLFPGTNTFFGMNPLFGSNIVLDALVAGVAFYFGYMKPVESGLSSPSSPQPSI